MERRVKIVCTLGPASLNEETLGSMMASGLNVARLNFSHGTQEEHLKALQLVRYLEERQGTPVAVMLDTAGPKMRTTVLAGNVPVMLEEGQFFTLRRDDGTEGNSQGVGTTYPTLAQECQVGQDVFIDDGTLHLRVHEIRGDDLVCRVLIGGELKNHKGINLPGAELSVSAMSDKDRDDILWGVRNDVDYVAVSFVRSRDDVMAVRRVIEEAGGSIKIIAKIETRAAVANLESIADVVDGMMIARGDLGVEIPTEEVPLVQKRIITLCRTRGKPTIVATQMLDSMIRNPRPTRAEANDVANAVLDGADAVMLSGESAAGKYPLLAVQTMARIVARTEEELPRWQRELNIPTERGVPDGVSMAAVEIARTMQARAVVCLTRSGSTARMVSKYRPVCPIVGCTPSLKTQRELCLCWGVLPLISKVADSNDDAIFQALEQAEYAGFIDKGDLVVLTAGFPLDVPGTTNTIQVLVISRVVATGLPVSPGVVTGRACVCRSADDLEQLQPGDILVVPETDRRFVHVMDKISALVTEENGLTSHGALVSLEMGVPAVVGAMGAVARIHSDSIITVDAGKGIVYEGRVNLGAK